MSMISVYKARQILGKTSDKFSDEELEGLIIQFSEIAEFITDVVGSKNTTTGIDLASKQGDN